jgi:alkanesulfonate monooxygenase
MHPHALATTIATFATLHERRVCIHWVTSRGDTALREASGGHDSRYEELVEYATLVRQLLEGRHVTYVSQHFGMSAVRLEPELSTPFRPGYMVSGSCPAGVAAARALGALPVYARPPEAASASRRDHFAALRLGIIARSDRDAAWHTAFGRFPPDRGGPLTRSVARKVSDSRWHLTLCRLAEERASSGDPFWLGPFDGYKSMCPYLVGSHEDVASAIAAYVRRGFTTFLLDEPETEAEVEHASTAFELATGQVVAA